MVTALSVVRDFCRLSVVFSEWLLPFWLSETFVGFQLSSLNGHCPFSCQRLLQVVSCLLWMVTSLLVVRDFCRLSVVFSEWSLPFQLSETFVGCQLVVFSIWSLPFQLSDFCRLSVVFSEWSLPFWLSETFVGCQLSSLNGHCPFNYQRLL